jgi:aspartyl protease family protein
MGEQAAREREARAHLQKAQEEEKAPIKSKSIARAPDIHFYPIVTINGKTLPMVADTGATNIALSRQDAYAIGIDVQNLRYTQETITANGVVRVAPVLLREISVEGFVLRNVTGDCCTDGESLLGMSALGQLKVQLDGEWMHITAR